MSKNDTMHSTEEEQQTAVLVSVSGRFQKEETTKEYLDELEFLAETSGLITLKRFTQRLDPPDKRTFVGKGKLEDIIAYVRTYKVDCVIFDDDLTPSQMRNLEDELQVKVYDRSLLILDIFLLRAKTAQSKVQVELARNQYLLPRLTRMWTHLERQRGGTGTRGGAGEKEIETDRRMIRDTLDVLKKKLAKIDKQNFTQRKNRDRQVRVALVGYTNVGKSTIMRTFGKADVFAENKLFATVDATVRKVVLSHIPFLLSDTVGFIRKLPHTLIECFKSTLDEVREADILIHVVDISHDVFEDQIKVVDQTLVEIKASEKPTLLVFNKIDQYKEKLRKEEAAQDPDDYDFVPAKEIEEQMIERLKRTYGNEQEGQSVIFISATEKENFEEFRKAVYGKVKERFFTLFPNYLHNPLYQYTEWDDLNPKEEEE